MSSNRLTADQKKQIEALLRQEREELQAHFDRQADDEADTLRDQTGELSAYDNHPAEMGTETFEKGRDQAVDRSLELQLERIDQALARLDTEEFGICEVSGEPIGFERLMAVPYATRCVEHAEDDVGASTEDFRPVEEQVMTPPPSGAGAARQANAGHFDEAGAWQALETYGSSDNPVVGPDRRETDEQLIREVEHEADRSR
ncbi:transcriptional regulator, TraR/DksA family [Paenibacillus sp. UNCCL117]|uniref:TraR/DksA C4-type zinc finger protein n=1 Tax=unclassified Paenibacillus TaxID=185978 RepID=UPI000880B8E6|nr:MULTISPECIES: TraR/DksA C4-type zinc finger protein [unclassified Paenibacillus]SDC92193.1 regulatory protein, yteA family [Paenibacillus sp. cl123]SFW29281.1 transcriptional regulator, TraR/DksA family [Paenibacillus sp. UNCCL117]